MKNIFKIEEHLFEDKNHKVRTEYRIFVEPLVYKTKTKSQLNQQEKNFPKTQIFHFQIITHPGGYEGRKDIIWERIMKSIKVTLFLMKT